MFKPTVWMQTFRYEPTGYADGDLIVRGKGYELAQVNPEVHNTLIYPGRLFSGYLLTGLASGGFLWVAAGSGSASVAPVDTINDDRLGGYPGSIPPAFEYIANGVRKKLQSTLYGGDLTTADWVAETYTDGLGNVFRAKCQSNVTFGPGDANGTVSGVPLRRYGFCLASPTPDTVTGYSNIMLNEMIDSADQNLTNANIVQTKFIFRI